MTTQIFVNLPVKDLGRSTEFWTKVGFTFNQQFTDENATSMVIDDEAGIYAMLLTEPFFKSFHDAGVPDPEQQREVIVALSVESRERVNELVDNAVAAGAPKAGEPKEEGGFMYSRDFNDPDGHRWEILWMDMSAVPSE
ncbi:MAG: VOC family protein [Micromonosporaceae bacterium]